MGGGNDLPQEEDRKLTPMTFRSLCLAATAIGAVAAAPAFAQTADEDVIIVTAPDYVPLGSEAANKTGMPLIETPQSVSLISRDQIDLLDWNNLSQTVRYVAGVTGENYGPDMRVERCCCGAAVDGTGAVVREHTVAAMLPDPFVLSAL